MSKLVYIRPGDSYGSESECHQLTEKGKRDVSSMASFLRYSLVDSKPGSFMVLLKKGNAVYLETARIVGKIVESPVYRFDEDGSWLTTSGERMTIDEAHSRGIDIIVIQNYYQEDESESRSPLVEMKPGTMVVCEKNVNVRYLFKSV